MQLDYNEYSGEIHPTTLQAYSDSAVDLPRYYRSGGSELERSIAQAFQIDATLCSQIFPIPGSDEGIFRWLLFCRSLGAGSFRTLHSPTYDHTLVFAHQLGFHTAHSAHEADAFYICTPNNPCGTTVSPARIVEIAREHPGRLLIDLSYFTFGSQSAGEYVTKAIDAGLSNCTFVVSGAKMFPLAGLRFGWMLSLDPEICDLARLQLNPKLLAPIARSVTMACLHEAEFYFAQNRVIFENRAPTARVLTSFLATHGIFLEIDLEGCGNFFRLHGDHSELSQASQLLLLRGIVIREKTHWPFLRASSTGTHLLQMIEARLSAGRNV